MSDAEPSKDPLGDRMKSYEGVEAERRFAPLLPIVARMDGRAFSSFTRGMGRPFDPQMSAIMIETARYLAQESNACMAYVQSDEITLAWHSQEPATQIYFDGRIMKMTSQLAAHATLRFNELVAQEFPEKLRQRPTFDARVWLVPSQTEAANSFLWREMDAYKNSVSMAAQTRFSDRELHGKSTRQKLEMLQSAGVDWLSYPDHFKRGTYIQRRAVFRPFSAPEIEALPPKHEARKNPALIVERSEFRQLKMPAFKTVTNREAVVFSGAEPETTPPST